MATKPKIDYTTLAANYGFALSVINSNHELKNLFDQAVAGTWTTDQFAAHLRNTAWFKTTSAAAREWIVLKGADPSTARQRVAERTATIITEAKTLGINLTAQQVANLANHSLMFGWTDQQIRNSVTSDWHFAPNTSLFGQAGASVQALRKAAQDYLVPVSDTTINNWVHRTLAGQATDADFTVWAQQQAKSLFPSLSHQIDQGLTVQQLADPYKQIAAQALGIDPNQVDMTQPKWRKALDQVDQKGNHTLMSLSDWQSLVRSDPTYGYDHSADGAQNAAKFATSLGQAFGAFG